MSSRDYDPKFRSAYNNGYIKGIKQGEAVEQNRILELLDQKRASLENKALWNALAPEVSEKYISKIEELDSYIALIKEKPRE